MQCSPMDAASSRWGEGGREGGRGGKGVHPMLCSLTASHFPPPFPQSTGLPNDLTYGRGLLQIGVAFDYLLPSTP